MLRRTPEALLLAASLAVVACAHPNRAESGTAEVARDTSTPVYMKYREGRPDLRRQGGGIYKVQIEVPVDEFGQPQIDRIHFAGTLPASAQQDVIAWLVGAKFVPATRNGVPVPGIYMLSL